MWDKKTPAPFSGAGAGVGLTLVSPRRPAPGLNKAENADENEYDGLLAGDYIGRLERGSEGTVRHHGNFRMLAFEWRRVKGASAPHP